MGDLLTAGLFRQMLRSATPVGLAAMGGLMTEHAGIMNIGMDGMILLGAFTAVAVSWLAGSAWLGLAAAILVGILAGLFFCPVCGEAEKRRIYHWYGSEHLCRRVDGVPPAGAVSGEGHLSGHAGPAGHGVAPG